MNDHIEPPKTVKEVGIHMGYMRDDIRDVKKLIRDLSNGFATKEDHARLEARVDVLEKRNGFKQTLLWVGLVASAIINIIVIYNLFSK